MMVRNLKNSYSAANVISGTHASVGQAVESRAPATFRRVERHVVKASEAKPYVRIPFRNPR